MMQDYYDNPQNYDVRTEVFDQVPTLNWLHDKGWILLYPAMPINVGDNVFCLATLIRRKRPEPTTEQRKPVEIGTLTLTFNHATKTVSFPYEEFKANTGKGFGITLPPDWKFGDTIPQEKVIEQPILTEIGDTYTHEVVDRDGKPVDISKAHAGDMLFLPSGYTLQPRTVHKPQGDE